jgi:hypothetical protein
VSEQEFIRRKNVLRTRMYQSLRKMYQSVRRMYQSGVEGTEEDITLYGFPMEGWIEYFSPSSDFFFVNEESGWILCPVGGLELSIMEAVIIGVFVYVIIMTEDDVVYNFGSEPN